MSSPFQTFRQALSSAALKSQGLPEDQAADLERQIRIPEAGRGDLALPCFQLAKQLKQNPAELARQVASALEDDSRWSRVEATGPYVNVAYDTKLLAGAVVPLAQQPGYGESDAGSGKTVVIDFSSPNIAKPLAFHHIRSTVIGAALGRLHQAQGWRVAGINYLGDWGKQFGLLATGFARHGDPEKRSNAKHLVEVYVKANREADVAGRQSKIAAPEEARALLAKFEAARDEASSASEAKEKKKANKSVKSLEKKINSLRKQKSGDPLEGAESWLNDLEAAAKEAAAELPAAEERDREARLFLKRMEEKDEAALAQWEEFRATSVEDFKRIYDRMGVSFEAIEGESFYQDVLTGAIERVKTKPGTRMSDGAEVVDMDYKAGEPPVILKTRDGTTLYATRDIAAAMDRFERFAFDRSLYVVAADQSLHFDHLFRTLDAMGFEWAGRCKHIAFGRIHGMSTRRGNVVFLDEVLEESVGKARGICEQSEKIQTENLEEVVEAIGVGAIVFGNLFNLRASNYTFDWDEVLNFSGHTAPYVQFSHARACSILRKAGGVPDTADCERLQLPEERAVMLALGRYPDAIAQACEAFEPSILTRALLEIAQSTASYLTSGNKDRSKRILLENDEPMRAARLQLINAVRNTLASGLAILGVKAPTSM